MAYARFFEKSAISAASLLRRFDYSGFRSVLEASTIGIGFDESAVISPEGRVTLDLLVDLLARLYPRIAIGRTDDALGDPSGTAQAMADRALAINPDIEITTDVASASSMVVVGVTPVAVRRKRGRDAGVVYVGSRGWQLYASERNPSGSGQTLIPFGAGAAACVGAAEIFRQVFQDQLESSNVRYANALRASEPDVDLSLSLLDWSVGGSVAGEAKGSDAAIDIGEAFLVGAGAIGNAAIWALARTPRLAGVLHVIDAENIELSNLQRYVLTSEAAIGRRKVDLAYEEMQRRASEYAHGVSVQPHALRWDEFMSERENFHLQRVLLALDSADDRIAVQSSLPRWVANAWTQPENLGVSRHPSFTREPCVACLYLPIQPRKSRDAIYAEALGMQQPDELMEIRRLLHSGTPVGETFLRRIASRLDVPFAPLAGFADNALERFYTEALCGGLILNLGGRIGAERNTEVPMAFQSALAGIALAAELVAEALKLRSAKLPCRSEIDLLRPIGTRLTSPAAKHPSGRCICQDAAYQRAYSAKYPDTAI